MVDRVDRQKRRRIPSASNPKKFVTEFSSRIGGLLFATKRRVARRRTMCRMKADLKWDDRLDAIPPLAGTLFAFLSLFFVLMIVMR
jgi:hypothetical protein